MDLMWLCLVSVRYSIVGLVLEFVDVRGDAQKAKGKPYGTVELSILDRIRALNHRGTSTTEDHGIRHKIVESKLQSNPV